MEFEYKTEQFDSRERDYHVEELALQGWTLVCERKCKWGIGTVCFFERSIENAKGKKHYVDATAKQRR